MHCLTETADPVRAQALCDALRALGIACRIDNTGMHALMPLPGLFDLRLMVADEDIEAARQVLADLDAAWKEGGQ
ncbi:MAG: DUF2007 domain-containing protein [Mariprofundaceae bacterium]